MSKSSVGLAMHLGGGGSKLYIRTNEMKRKIVSEAVTPPLTIPNRAAMTEERAVEGVGPITVPKHRNSAKLAMETGVSSQYRPDRLETRNSLQDKIVGIKVNERVLKKDDSKETIGSNSQGSQANFAPLPSSYQKFGSVNPESNIRIFEVL